MYNIINKGCCRFRSKWVYCSNIVKQLLQLKMQYYCSICYVCVVVCFYLSVFLLFSWAMQLELN